MMVGRVLKQLQWMRTSLPAIRGLLPLILLLLVWQLVQSGPSPYFPAPSQWWAATVTLFNREHLLSAFIGTGIDNAIVELDNLELPILDGSARPFVEAIRKVGIRKQRRPRTYLRIRRELELREGDKFIAVYPADTYSVSYSINFPHPLIGKETFSVDLSDGNYLSEIAPARTFGFLHEAEAMRDRRRHQDGDGRRKRERRGLDRHLAAAALDQKNLKEVAVAMGADGPVVHRRARGNRLDMDEIECLIVRRIAVKMEQREGERHARSLAHVAAAWIPRALAA